MSARAFRLFVDDFTGPGLGELSKAEAMQDGCVLAALAACPKFSVFEATANQTIATTMDRLTEQGFITLDNSPGYPWSRAMFTDKGNAEAAKWRAEKAEGDRLRKNRERGQRIPKGKRP